MLSYPLFFLDTRSNKSKRTTSVRSHTTPSTRPSLSTLRPFSSLTSRRKNRSNPLCLKDNKSDKRKPTKRTSSSVCQCEQVEQITPQALRGKPSSKIRNVRTPLTLNLKHNAKATLRVGLEEVPLLLLKEVVRDQEISRRVQDEGQDCLTIAAKEVRSLEGNV